MTSSVRSMQRACDRRERGSIKRVRPSWLSGTSQAGKHSSNTGSRWCRLWRGIVANASTETFRQLPNGLSRWEREAHRFAHLMRTSIYAHNTACGKEASHTLHIMHTSHLGRFRCDCRLNAWKMKKMVVPSFDNTTDACSCLCGGFEARYDDLGRGAKGEALKVEYLSIAESFDRYGSLTVWDRLQNLKHTKVDLPWRVWVRGCCADLVQEAEYSKHGVPAMDFRDQHPEMFDGLSTIEIQKKWKELPGPCVMLDYRVIGRHWCNAFKNSVVRDLHCRCRWKFQSDLQQYPVYGAASGLIEFARLNLSKNPQSKLDVRSLEISSSDSDSASDSE